MDLSKKIVFGVACAGLGAVIATLFDAAARQPVQEEPPIETSEEAQLAQLAEEDATPPPQPLVPTRRRLVESRSQALELEQLQALGYVDGTYDPESEKKDVLLNKKGATHEGYNFYSSRRAQGARLIDMEGRTVHTWRTREKGAWQHAELLPNGDVIVIVKDKRLSQYDKDSNLLWSVEGRFHHDLWVHDNEIYVLARVARVIDYIHSEAPALVDVIQVRSLDGELTREVSILGAIHDSAYGFLLPIIPRQMRTKKGVQLDVLHTNHVEVFDGWLGHRHPIYAKGNILVSMRNINAIAILDGNTFEVLWIWGPTNLTFQHHPTLLKNGNILLFDNGKERSRVIEIDPLSREVEWDYAPKSGFFSSTRGSNQRLPNRNTLITESDRGYVFEVTPDRKVVWKFANPIVNRKSEREAIWRMTRVDPKLLTFLD